MIMTKSIIKAVLAIATKEAKDAIINELLNHVREYDYNGRKTEHILEMLCDKASLVKIENINIDYIKSHTNLITYKHEEVNITNVTIESIDNIEGTITVGYDFIEKINEDRGDISPVHSRTSISFLDNQELLKKS